MGRTYAGILGPLALVVTVLRALRTQAGVEQTLGQGLLWMFIFAAVGFAIGLWAEWIVEDSVRGQVAEKLAAVAANTSTNQQAGNAK